MAMEMATVNLSGAQHEALTSTQTNAWKVIFSKSHCQGFSNVPIYLLSKIFRTSHSIFFSFLHGVPKRGWNLSNFFTWSKPFYIEIISPIILKLSFRKQKSRKFQTWTETNHFCVITDEPNRNKMVAATRGIKQKKVYKLRDPNKPFRTQVVVLA